MFNALESAALRHAAEGGDHAALRRLMTEGQAGAAAISITTATISLNRGEHGGRTMLFNRAGGIVATLPNAEGSQDEYNFVVQTAFTSDGIIKVARAADTMIGYLAASTVSFAAGSNEGVGGTDDTITMNGTTTGGLAGSYLMLKDIAANLWLVRGFLVGSGTVATSLSATVS
jgi:hypothetical protein